MNYKLLSSSLSIVLTIFMIMKNTLDFNPIKFHCENYVLNSYLYLFLTVAILFTSLFSLEHIDLNIRNLFTGSSRFLLLVLSMILIFSVIVISPRMFFMKHLLWTLFIIITSVFLYPMFKEKSSIFYHSGITTIIIISLLSTLAFLKPDLIKDSWFTPLLLGLIVLLISSIIERLMANWGYIHPNKYNRIVAYVTIGLFSLFVLYDTKQIIKNADKCVNPDYINQSLDLFLDALNIFTGTAVINE